MTLAIFFAFYRYYDWLGSAHNAYLGEPKEANGKHIKDYLSFLILFNYLIPISLYVTIELHKFLGSLFLEWDLDLYDEQMNQQCIVNTSNLNEELGQVTNMAIATFQRNMQSSRLLNLIAIFLVSLHFQVKILFSDKTGTLTKNEMTLQQCSINGKKYTIQSFGLQEENSPNVIRLPQYDRYMLNFLQTLSVCHTVQVAKLDPPDDDSDNEKSFEIVASNGSLIDIDEDAKQKEQTRQNTKANEIIVPENLLDEMPIQAESESNALIFLPISKINQKL